MLARFTSARLEYAHTWILSVKSVRSTCAVLFGAGLALLAVGLKAGARLGAYTNTVADFDATLDLVADSYSLAYDLMPDNNWVIGGIPA